MLDTTDGVDHLAGPSEERSGPSVFVVAASAAALTVSHGLILGYTDNQNTYLARAVSTAGQSELQADRLVSSADPTPTFTAAMSVVLRLTGGVFGTYVLWVLAGFAFYSCLWWATAPERRSRPVLAGWTMLLVLVMRADDLAPALTPLTEVVQGVAGQYALGHYLQPSTAAVLMVAAAAWWIRRGQPSVPVATLFLAAVVHPSYVAAAWTLALSIAVSATRSAGWAWRPAARCVGIAAVGTATVVLGNPTLLSSLSDPAGDTAGRILVFDRVPHHALPSAWFDRTDLLLLVALAITAWCASRSADPASRRLSAFVGLGASVTLLVSVVAAVGSHPNLLLAFPWRTSVVLAPLAVSYLLGSVAQAVVARVKVRHAGVALLVLSATIVATGVWAGARDTARSRGAPRPVEEVAVALQEQGAEGEGLIPPGRTDGFRWLQDLRLVAARPIYVDWKSNPNEPTAVVAWRARIAEAEVAMLDPARLCELIQRESIGWVVLPPGPARAAPCLETWSSTQLAELEVRSRARSPRRADTRPPCSPPHPAGCPSNSLPDAPMVPNDEP